MRRITFFKCNHHYAAVDVDTAQTRDSGGRTYLAALMLEHDTYSSVARLAETEMVAHCKRISEDTIRTTLAGCKVPMDVLDVIVVRSLVGALNAHGK